MDVDYDPLAGEKESFVAWCLDFEAVSDSSNLLASLADCFDQLPIQICEVLDLQLGSSYADAVEFLRSRWSIALEAFIEN